MDFDRIKHYFPHLTSDQEQKLIQLKPLYEFWNAQINVISRKDLDHFYERHVLHSLAIYKFMPFLDHASILDVGTGGGFPGIPLSILNPTSNFHLVDSIGKKIKVVNEIAHELSLSNVTTQHARAEQVSDRYDFIVSRAVTRMKPFMQWVRQKVKKESQHSLPNGILALKGGDLSDELSEIRSHYRTIDISTYYKEEFFKTKQIVYVKL